MQSLHLNISSLIRRRIYMYVHLRSFRHPRVLALSHEQDISSLTVHSFIHTTVSVAVLMFTGGVTGSEPTGEQTAQETDILSGEQIRGQVL